MSFQLGWMCSHYYQICFTLFQKTPIKERKKSKALVQSEREEESEHRATVQPPPQKKKHVTTRDVTTKTCQSIIYNMLRFALNHTYTQLRSFLRSINGARRMASAAPSSRAAPPSPRPRGANERRLKALLIFLARAL